jgi:hypothetical protein
MYIYKAMKKFKFRKIVETCIYSSNLGAMKDFYVNRIGLEFAPGEWLLSSYIATGMENVPIFIKAYNAEREIESFLANK